MDLFWEHDYSKRGFLLPEGCKDLMDVLKAKQTTKQQPFIPLVELAIPEHATVSEVATLVNRKPFQIVADLMEIGIFVTFKEQLDFEIISRVVRKYGFIAKKAV